MLNKGTLVLIRSIQYGIAMLRHSPIFSPVGRSKGLGNKMANVTKSQWIFFKILAIHFFISIAFSLLAGFKRQMLQMLINRKTIAANNRDLVNPDNIIFHEQADLINPNSSKKRAFVALIR